MAGKVANHGSLCNILIRLPTNLEHRTSLALPTVLEHTIAVPPHPSLRSMDRYHILDDFCGGLNDEAESTSSDVRQNSGLGGYP